MGKGEESAAAVAAAAGGMPAEAKAGAALMATVLMAGPMALNRHRRVFQTLYRSA